MPGQKVTVDIVEIDREIAEIDATLQEQAGLVQRRADLENFKVMARRLWGIGAPIAEPPRLHSLPAVQAPLPGYTAPEHSNGNGTKQTTARIAQIALATRGNMNTIQLVKAMREAGWKGSGDDTIDKKRVYAGIYNKPEFKFENGEWSLK